MLLYIEPIKLFFTEWQTQRSDIISWAFPTSSYVLYPLIKGVLRHNRVGRQPRRRHMRVYIRSYLEQIACLVAKTSRKKEKINSQKSECSWW